MARKKNLPECTESDSQLFLRYMGGVAPKGEAERSESQAPKPAAKKNDLKKPSVENESDFQEMLDRSFENHPELLQKLNQNQNAQTSKTKAVARSNGPDATIDLHACILETALKRTEEFLLHCQAKRFRKVLIIHGKGSGVLMEGVRKYLRHHPRVLQVEDAERRHGGSGAAMVLLKN